MFSSSFASSAASGDETGGRCRPRCSYRAAAASVQASVMPPTTFGTFFVVQSSRPGSTRSGENARKKSLPAVEARLPSRTRQQLLARRARVGGGLEDDEVARGAAASRSRRRRPSRSRGPARAASRAASAARSGSRRRRAARRSRSLRAAHARRRAASGRLRGRPRCSSRRGSAPRRARRRGRRAGRNGPPRRTPGRAVRRRSRRRRWQRPVIGGRSVPSQRLGDSLRRMAVAVEGGPLGRHPRARNGRGRCASGSSSTSMFAPARRCRPTPSTAASSRRGRRTSTPPSAGRPSP